MNKKSKQPTNKTCCQHEWAVFETYSDGPCLLVECAECCAIGGIFETTHEEWCEALGDSEEPYRWYDDSRVTVFGSGSRPHVIKAASLQATKKLSEDALLGAFDDWLITGRPETVEVDGERHVAAHICKILKRCDLAMPERCSGMLGLPTATTYGEAVRLLA